MNIALIQGHPDPPGGHFCNARAQAYAEGAAAGGHAVRLVGVAKLGYSLVHDAIARRPDPPLQAIAQAQDAIRPADLLVLVAASARCATR